MKRILFFLGLCGIFGACTNDKYNCGDTVGLLTPDELSWLSYSGGETLIYKSNTGLYDTAKVTTPYVSEAINNNDTSLPCKHYYQSVVENIDLGEKYWQSPAIVGFGITVSHYNQWNPQNLNSASIFGSRYGWFYFSNYIPQNNVIINGNLYDNVYIVTRDTTTTFGIFWRVYYTKQKGVLEFDLTNGDQWVRVN